MRLLASVPENKFGRERFFSMRFSDQSVILRSAMILGVFVIAFACFSLSAAAVDVTTTAAPAVSPLLPLPEVALGTLPSGYKEGSVNTDTLNLRANPSTSADKLGTLSRGTKVAIYQGQDGWYQILADNGLKGWVSGQYIALAQVQISSVLPEAPEKLVWSGQGEGPGKVQVQCEQTNFGLRVTLSGGEAPEYTLKRQGQDVVLEAGQVMEGNLGSWGKYNVAWDQDQTRLRITGSGTFYVQDKRDGDDLIIELADSPLVGKIIYLDPGHGCYENGVLQSGALGSTGLQEKDVTLSVALKAKKLLANLGADVRLTHEDASALTLQERAWMANAADADLFISIHCNSFTNPSAKGTSTWFYAPEGGAFDRGERKEFAEIMQKAMLAATGLTSYGVREERFLVLRETTMPSVLLETAFISNPQEEKLLASDSFRQKLAEGICNGVVNYIQATSR